MDDVKIRSLTDDEVDQKLRRLFRVRRYQTTTSTQKALARFAASMWEQYKANHDDRDFALAWERNREVLKRQGEEAVAIAQKMYGRNDPRVAVELRRLSQILAHNGDLKGANKRLAQANAIDKKVLAAAVRKARTSSWW
jgi:hypothetical protein